MNTDLERDMVGKYTDITRKIIAAFYEVYNKLGYGFQEKVYENSIAIVLRNQELSAVQQMPISVFYEGAIVGEYYADIVVEDKVILELKAAREVSDEHEAQLLNYMKATKYEVGLLLNFGARPRFVRKI